MAGEVGIAYLWSRGIDSDCISGNYGASKGTLVHVSCANEALLEDIN